MRQNSDDAEQSPDDRTASAVDDDLTVFPELLPDTDDGELEMEFAAHIAHDVAGILQPMSHRNKKKLYPSRSGRQFSSSSADDRDPQPLARALDRLVSRRGWQSQISVRRILDKWPQIVGETNAEHVTASSFDEHVLVVQADSSTWAAVIRQLAPQVVAKINAELGQGSVTRIDVRGPAATSWSYGRRSIRGSRGPRDTYG